MPPTQTLTYRHTDTLRHVHTQSYVLIQDMQPCSHTHNYSCSHRYAHMHELTHPFLPRPVGMLPGSWKGTCGAPRDTGPSGALCIHCTPPFPHHRHPSSCLLSPSHPSSPPSPARPVPAPAPTPAPTPTSSRPRTTVKVCRVQGGDTQALGVLPWGHPGVRLEEIMG